MNTTEDLTDYASLALAALVGAAQGVHALANGHRESAAERAILTAAIPTQHAASLKEIFPEVANYRGGIKAAIRALGGESANPEVLRYVLQLLDLARRLKRNPMVLQRLQEGLEQLSDPPTDTELASLYQDTISTLGKRIQVTGDPARLQQTAIANSIRSLLLAGVRFGWLWQQLGGSHWQLVLRRRVVLSALESLQNTLRVH